MRSHGTWKSNAVFSMLKTEAATGVVTWTLTSSSGGQTGPDRKAGIPDGTHVGWPAVTVDFANTSDGQTAAVLILAATAAPRS